jgi:nitrate reductase assembly molybdenum cofactor insertion protein NarJ
MDPTPDSTLDARCRTFTLASLATAYPTAEVVEVFDNLRDELHDHPGFGPLVASVRGGPDGLQGSYLDLFDQGKERVALYETEYGRMRGLSKGKDLADIVGFYRAFGVDLDHEDDVELPDHVAVELEFYSILLYKSAALAKSGDREGTEIVEDARRKFLTDHLGCFIGAIAARPTVAGHPVYGPLLAYCAEVVAAECQRMGVVPAPLDFFAPDDNAEPANCGGCVSIPGMVDDPLRGH